MVSVTHSAVDPVGGDPAPIRAVRVRLLTANPRAKVYRVSDGAQVVVDEHVPSAVTGQGGYPNTVVLQLAPNDSYEPAGTWYEVAVDLDGVPDEAPVRVVVPSGQAGPLRLRDLLVEPLPTSAPIVVGWLPRGDYTSTDTYYVRDVVYHDDASWVARRTVTNVEPGTDATAWQQTAGKGPQGPQGDPGGPMGPQGIPGPTGPPGRSVDPEGSVPTKADLLALPTQAKGKAWLVAANKHIYVYEGNEASQVGQPGYDAAVPGWTDLGDIAGPQGVQGIQGAKGDPGSSGGDYPEYSRVPLTAVVATPLDLVGKLTRYNTTSAIAQPIPPAIPGRSFAVGWDAGSAALSLTAATRTDTATVTSGSSSVSDSSITAADQYRAVTGTGIPPGTYVGAVTPGTSFLLSSSPTSQVNVNATAAGTSVTIADQIGESLAATFTVPVLGDVHLLHCTHQGLWRTWLGHKRQSALDARYIAYETGVTTAFRAANTAVQAIPPDVQTTVLFPTVQSSSPLVTTSTQGAGTLFTVSRAGTWAITATVRLPAAASGSAGVNLLQLVSGTTTELTAHTGVFGGGSFGRSVFVIDYFAAGTGFYVGLLQGSGASMNTDPLGGTRVNFRLAWVHP